MQEAGAEALEEYRPRAEVTTWANVERTRGDLQTMYLDRYLGFVSGNTGLERLVGLLTNEVTVPGRELDQDRRWSALQALSSEGHPRVDPEPLRHWHEEPFTLADEGFVAATIPLARLDLQTQNTDT